MTEKQANQELEGFHIVTRHLVMEKDLNYHGNLYGGTMLAWLDESSALYIMESIGYTNFVTAGMENVKFKSPARSGEAVVFYCRTAEIGRSSITVQTRAFVHDPLSDRKDEIINCSITFVCLKDGKPFAYFESEDYKNRRGGLRT
ncbi:MAG: acyl-CoA thioesterase [Leptospiraceae bacterium]|nr:acyl-CoA thioesterase [Leptospiraceae bacterium]